MGEEVTQKVCERWKDIAGFDGLYAISDKGRVRSLKGSHGQWTVLNPKLPDTHYAYKAVSLRKDGKRLRRYVHSLVAYAFLPPRPSSEHEVRHLNGERGDNHIDNLAWGTRKENAADRERHGRTARGARHGMFGVHLPRSKNGYAKLTDEQVSDILVAPGSQRAIAKKFGVSQKCIWRILCIAALKARSNARRDVA